METSHWPNYSKIDSHTTWCEWVSWTSSRHWTKPCRTQQQLCSSHHERATSSYTWYNLQQQQSSSGDDTSRSTTAATDTSASFTEQLCCRTGTTRHKDFFIRDDPDTMLLMRMMSDDADFTISINDRCWTCDLYQYAKYEGVRFFSEFQNGLLPIRPLANLRTSVNCRPLTEHFRFELATFCDKNRQATLRQSSFFPMGELLCHWR